jgi:hypothetical protein
VLIFDRAWPYQWAEAFFACPAHRATPIIRGFVKGRSFLDLAFAITFVRVVNATAIGRLALIHLFWVGHCTFLCVAQIIYRAGIFIAQRIV